MFNLPERIFSPGNIIGLGESSHGLATESNWKHDLILDYIRNNKEKKITIFFEAYEDPIRDLSMAIQNKTSLIEKDIKNSLNRLYKIWQTKETYNFLSDLSKLILAEGSQIQIYGVDFKNSNVKKSMDQEDMLASRSRVIFQNVKKGYNKDALHFFSAHNFHIGRYDENGEKDVGKLLDDEFHEKYISVAQHTSKGIMRARKPDGIYGEVEFAFTKTENSVTVLSEELFKNKQEGDLIILPTSDVLCENVNLIEQAGFFWPLKEPWLTKMGPEYFDYLVVHRRGDPLRELV